MFWSGLVRSGSRPDSGPVQSGSKKLEDRGTKTSELGPGPPLDGFSVKNYRGGANFQLQWSSERQLAFSGLVQSGSGTSLHYHYFL